MHTIVPSGRLRRAPGSSRLGASLLAGLSGLLSCVLHRLEIARQRRQLARLDDYMLRDIGLSRADVEPEIKKPFWRD